MMGNRLQMLPPKVDLDKKEILKQLAKSHKALAELKGYSDTIPNKHILINAITINESKDSSEIENIITTHDELFKTMSISSYNNPEAKEVLNYRRAIWKGYELIKTNGFLSTNMLIEIQEIIEPNKPGIRRVPGTVLRNENTGEIIYKPPEGEAQIIQFMNNLETFINIHEDGRDPLVDMAIVHYQFESIHPFYDGNGRTGRIINILHLILKGLLDSPILYLSKYIIENKSEYYRLLQGVTENNDWESWIIYILKGIEETSKETLSLVKTINELMINTGDEIRERLPRIYSKELVELIFFEFYTKISYIEEGLGITRKTASKYLAELEEERFLQSEKIGREKVYMNKALFNLVKNSIN